MHELAHATNWQLAFWQGEAGTRPWTEFASFGLKGVGENSGRPKNHYLFGCQILHQEKTGANQFG
jgi:hypothetical protein